MGTYTEGIDVFIHGRIEIVGGVRTQLEVTRKDCVKSRNLIERMNWWFYMKHGLHEIARRKLRKLLERGRFGFCVLGIPVSRNEKLLLSLKNAYREKRAFIIGNGPSLRKTNIKLLKDEITIGCNGIFLMFDEMDFIPTFYTVEDTLVAEDRAGIINGLRGTVKIFPYDLRHWLKADNNTIYINFLRRYPGFPKLTENFPAHVYWGGTVTFMNLQLAYYLGIKEVYLIGVDHEYHGPRQGDQQQGAVITSQSRDINHFHPDYFGPGFRYHDPKVERMEVAYRKARDFFESRGRCIYNATIGGKLDVFPRVSFDKLMN